MSAIEAGSEWVRCCGQRVTVTAVTLSAGSERLQIEGGERVIVRDEPERWRQRTMLTATFRTNYTEGAEHAWRERHVASMGAAAARTQQHHAAVERWVRGVTETR